MSPQAILLSAILAGDVALIDALRRIPQIELRQAATEVGRLRVDRTGLIRVLQAWRSGEATPEQVRWWAIFLFLGAFPQDWSPHSWHAAFDTRSQPLHIDYAEDDLMNEMVSRLKDLGDAVDGEITAAEREQMIRSLEMS